MSAFEKSTKTTYRSTCKKCRQTQRKTRDQTLPGVILVIYNSQVGSSKHRGHPVPTYSQQELSNFLQSNKTFMDLYENWKQQKYPLWKKPSCDRIDSNKPYTLENLQVITWKENQSNGALDVKNGVIPHSSKPVIQLTLDGKEVQRYHSTQAAARAINAVSSSRIAAVARKTPGRHTAYGYKWEYE